MASRLRFGDMRAVVSLASILPLATAVHAQEAATANGGDVSVSKRSDAAQDAQVIVVTGVRELAVPLAQPTTAGSRLGLSSLQTPATVNVISGDLIRAFGDTRLIDAVSRAPGISPSPQPGNGNNFFTARGFYGSTSVMELYNGKLLRIAGNTTVFPFDPWDVDRVEILSGPASVLYGTGAIGGAINVVSRQPDASATSGRAELSYGSYNSWHTAADITGPLGKSLSYRAAVSRYSSDSWFDRGGSNSLAVTGALRFASSDAFDATLSGDYGNQHLSTYVGTPLLNGVPVDGLLRKNYNVRDSYDINRTYLSSLDVHWRPASNIVLREYAYYARTERPFSNSNTFTYQPATDTVRRTGYQNISSQPYKQYGNSGDATISFPLGGVKNELLLGYDVAHGHAQRADNSSLATGGFVGSTTVNARTFDPGFLADGGAPALSPRSTGALDQVSAYGEDRLVFTRTLSLVTGFRYDHYHVVRHDLIAMTTFGGNYASTSFHVGGVYAPISTLSFYAQYATASDPFTALAPGLTAAQVNYKLSKGEQEEVGVKGSLFDSRLEFTFAGYHIIKHDLLTPTVQNPAVSEQVGSQSSRGLELTIAVHLLRGLTLQGNGTILRAKFDNFLSTIAGKPTSLAGYRPQIVPQKTANAAAVWSFLPHWQLRGAVRYVGDRFVDNANTVSMPAYTVADAGITWTPFSHLRLDLRTNNIFDERYEETGSSTTQVIIGDPRTVTLTADVSF